MEAVGFGRVLLREGEGFSQFQARGTVVPKWRGRGVGTQILAECERRAKARLDEVSSMTVEFQALADRTQLDVAELLTSCGLSPVRYFFQMIYDAPEMPVRPDYPAGYTVRSFLRNQDEETVWRVTNRSFRDHWRYTEDLLEEWLAWYDSDYFDPTLSISAWTWTGLQLGCAWVSSTPSATPASGEGKASWRTSVSFSNTGRRAWDGASCWRGCGLCGAEAAPT